MNKRIKSGWLGFPLLGGAKRYDSKTKFSKNYMS